ncbi:MAG: ABC transporter substrate-binding protein [Anaerolineae bacterium]
MSPLTRREFLRLSGLTVAGMAAAACGARATRIPEAAPVVEKPAEGQAPAAAPQAEAAPASKYSEAPQLAELVRQGKLPPVDERLPENPVVVPVVERVGQYGGTMRTALVGGADPHIFTRTLGYENLVRWDPPWTQVMPNVAEAWEANESATEFVFHLRKGMRWSDGEPFTADDILFWYEDVFMNDELTPSKGGWMTIKGEPGKVEKIDDYTVKFVFPKSHGLFILRNAEAGGVGPTTHPKHYLQQFHPRYNPDAVALAEKEGFDNWMALFNSKGGAVDADRFKNRDIPVLFAWRVTVPPGEATVRAEAERNPYYWKVDPEGNQLPYIDRIAYDLLENSEVLVLKVLNGEIDFQDRHIAEPVNKPMFIDNMEKGKYRLFTTTPTTVNNFVVMLNLSHKDPMKRELFRNKDFRIGLSYAINRQEIIDLIHVGQGEPWQAAPRPESPFHHERLAKQYTEYDLDRANEYLDRAGLTQRDADGFRLGPDGKRLTLYFEFDSNRMNFPETAQLIQGYWKAVGIDTQLKPEDRSLWEVRCRQGIEFDVTAHRFGGGAGFAVVLDPRYYVPVSGGNSMYAQTWQTWYNNPSGIGTSIPPEEPPEPVKEAMDLYTELLTTADPDKQHELMMKILDIAADMFYVIGTSLEANGYGVVTNRLRNVPEVMPDSWIYPHPAPTNPCQYFIDENA